MSLSPFLSFLIIISTLILSSLSLIQTPKFAKLIKSTATRYLPSELGITPAFSNITFKYFPPGLSIQKPKIIINEPNSLGLPPNSSIEADRIDFEFRFFQIFSGNIHLQKVVITNGKIRTILNQNQLVHSQKTNKTLPTQTPLNLPWDALFQIHTDTVQLKNVQFDIEEQASTLTTGDKATNTGSKLKPPSAERLQTLLQGTATHLSVSQSTENALPQNALQSGLGYGIELEVQNLQGEWLNRNSPLDSIEKIKLDGFFNALGLKLDNLEISNPGFSLSTQGNFHGNFFENQNIIANLQIKGQADTRKVLDQFPQIQTILKEKLNKSTLESLQGKIFLASQITGNLFKPLETLQVHSTLQLKDFHFKEWKIDSGEIEGKWNASQTGGTLTLSRARFSTAQTSRIMNTQPAGGGKIEIGPTQWIIGSKNPVKIPLRLENAHLHWLAAPGIKKIYGLDFRITGTANSTFHPPTEKTPWNLHLDLKAFIDPFHLDNQKLNQTKPLTTLFHIPKITLESKLNIDAQSIDLDHVKLALPHTNLQGQGTIDFQTGLDLNVVGTADLKDLGEIAENGIHGNGTVDVYVHGPFSSVVVDINTDLKNAQYLKLNFGDFKGKIIWDDDPDLLLFENVHLTKNTLRAQGNGKIDFSLDHDIQKSLDFGILIFQGDFQDLSHIFSAMTHSISWYPHDLTGPIHGDIKITGGLNASQLRVLGELKSPHLEYQNERFRDADFIGGYYEGKYFITNGTAYKGLQKILAKVSYDQSTRLDWKIETEKLSLADFDHIARLDIPLRGNFTLQSTGTGKLDALQSTTQLDFDDFKVRGIPMGESHFSFITTPGVAKFHASILGSQSEINSDYHFNSKELSTLHAQFDHFDSSSLLLFINPQQLQDESLSSYFTGKVDLSFNTGDWEHSDGRLDLTELVISQEDSRFQLARPISIPFIKGNFDNNRLIFQSGPQNRYEQVRFDLANQGGKLNGYLTGNLDLSILKYFTPLIFKTNGSAQLDFALGGTIKNPTFNGRALLDGDFIKFTSIDSPIENLKGTFQLNQNKITAKDLTGTLGGGRIDVNGQVCLYSDKYPELNIAGNFNGTRLKIYPFQYVKFSGPLSISANQDQNTDQNKTTPLPLPYVIEGNLKIESALSSENVINRKSGPGETLKSLQYLPPSQENKTGSHSSFKLNVHLNAPQGIVFQNDLFQDVQAKAKLTIVNTLDAPRILGTADIIQGKLLFKDHAFQIHTASVIFDNPIQFNPRFDLNGTTEINNIKIGMYINGRLNQIDKLKVDFNSNPAMSQADILSLLATGFTSTDAKKLSGNDLTVVQQGEAASLVLHSLGFNKDLQDKTGFQVQLDESVNSQQGVSAFRPQAQATGSAAPLITIRRRLNDRLSLSAGSTIGVGTNQSYQMNLDYMVSHHFSLSGVFMNYGTSGSADTSRVILNSVGMDFKFQRKFK